MPCASSPSSRRCWRRRSPLRQARDKAIRRSRSGLSSLFLRAGSPISPRGRSARACRKHWDSRSSSRTRPAPGATSAPISSPRRRPTATRSSSRRRPTRSTCRSTRRCLSTPGRISRRWDTGQQRTRAGRARAQQPGQAQLRLERQRHEHPPLGRAAEVLRKVRRGARSLPRGARGDDCAARRRRGFHVRRAVDLGAADPGRQNPPARRHLAHPQPDVSRRADPDRVGLSSCPIAR